MNGFPENQVELNLTITSHTTVSLLENFDTKTVDLIFASEWYLENVNS